MTAVIEAESPPHQHARGRWALSVLRGITAVHVVAIFAQPVFAGRFLIGDYDMLSLHALGADVVFYLGLAQPAAALVLALRGGPRWPVLASLGLLAGETGQYFAGLAGALELHLPLGVALITAAVLVLIAVWRPQPLGTRRWLR